MKYCFNQFHKYIPIAFHYTGSRCCFTPNREIQRPPCRHWRGNVNICVVNSTLFTHWSSFVVRSDCFLLFLGRLGFHTQICQRRHWQRQPEAGPHSPGAASKGTGSPSVSDTAAELMSERIHNSSNLLVPEHKHNGNYKCFIARNVHSRSAGRPTIHLLKEQGKQLFLFYSLLTDWCWELKCNSSDFHQGSKRLCFMLLMGNPLLPWREWRLDIIFLYLPP